MPRRDQDDTGKTNPRGWRLSSAPDRTDPDSKIEMECLAYHFPKLAIQRSRPEVSIRWHCSKPLTQLTTSSRIHWFRGTNEAANPPIVRQSRPCLLSSMTRLWHARKSTEKENRGPRADRAPTDKENRWTNGVNQWRPVGQLCEKLMTVQKGQEKVQRVIQGSTGSLAKEFRED